MNETEYQQFQQPEEKKERKTLINIFYGVLIAALLIGVFSLGTYLIKKLEIFQPQLPEGEFPRPSTSSEFPPPPIIK